MIATLPHAVACEIYVAGPSDAKYVIATLPLAACHGMQRLMLSTSPHVKYVIATLPHTMVLNYVSIGPYV